MQRQTSAINVYRICLFLLRRYRVKVKNPSSAEVPGELRVIICQGHHTVKSGGL